MNITATDFCLFVLETNISVTERELCIQTPKLDAARKRILTDPPHELSNLLVQILMCALRHQIRAHLASFLALHQIHRSLVAAASAFQKTHKKSGERLPSNPEPQSLLLRAVAVDHSVSAIYEAGG